MTEYSTNDQGKRNLDNRADQLNPNNDKYRKSRERGSRSGGSRDQSRSSTSQAGNPPAPPAQSQRAGTANTRSRSMTPDAAARIQSGSAKKHGGATPKGSFAARSQSAASRRNRGKP